MAGLRTLHDILDRLPEHGERPAILALQEESLDRWSYAQLADQAQKLAGGLADVVGPGDHVVLLAPPQPAWITACLGLIEAGAVVVPLDVQLNDDDLTGVLEEAKPSAIFTTRKRMDRIQELDVDIEPQFVLLDEEEDSAEKDERNWRHRMAKEGNGRADVDPDDTAVLFYTSGTTGPPKGVPLSHRNLTASINAVLEANFVSEDDRVLQPLPLHHVYPFVMGTLTPLAKGLPIVLPHALTGPQIARAMREGEVTLLIGIPRLYRALYSGIEGRITAVNPIVSRGFHAVLNVCVAVRRRLGLRLGKLLLRPVHGQFGPNLRILASGGSALDPELAWKLEGLGWQIATGYGLTETSPVLTLNPPGEARIGSAGRPVDDVAIRIDPSARPQAEGGETSDESATDEEHEEGEILAKGPNVFSGYYKMPEKTEEAFSDDGWFRTGDLGYMDDEGYLYITGRVSTMLITESGEKVQPDEVEEVYASHPVIREIGVLQREEGLVALVVPNASEIDADEEADQHEAIADAVQQALNERSQDLASYKQVTDFAITRKSLPRTRLGKIRRHKLEEHYKEAAEGREEEVGPIPIAEMSTEDRALLDNPVARAVWEWLAETYADRELTPDASPQFDLGVDSLDWVNITLEIQQRTGVELDEEAIGRIETVRDLLQEVAEAPEIEGAAEAPIEEPEETLDEEQKQWLQPLHPMQWLLARTLYQMIRALMHGPYHLQVEGGENLPDEAPYVVISNHVSYLDPLAVAAALSNDRLRNTYWAAARLVVFRNPLFRGFARLVKAVPIDSRRSVVSSLALGAAVIKRDKTLIWFPEGQRSQTGELQSFKQGIGRVLEKHPVPVVPTAVKGTADAWPVGQLLPRLGRVTVVFGEAADPQQLAEEGEGEEPYQRIVQALQARVAALL